MLRHLLASSEKITAPTSKVYTIHETDLQQFRICISLKAGRYIYSGPLVIATASRKVCNEVWRHAVMHKDRINYYRAIYG